MMKAGRARAPPPVLDGDETDSDESEGLAKNKRSALEAQPLSGLHKKIKMVSPDAGSSAALLASRERSISPSDKAGHICSLIAVCRQQQNTVGVASGKQRGERRTRTRKEESIIADAIKLVSRVEVAGGTLRLLHLHDGNSKQQHVQHVEDLYRECFPASFRGKEVRASLAVPASDCNVRPWCRCAQCCAAGNTACLPPCVCSTASPLPPP